LGFLRDWGTSLVQLDTAAIGALGPFLGFGDFARSPVLGIGYLHHAALKIAIAEVVLIGLSALSFFISLIFGLLLLNALPGAIQRVPVNLDAMQSDVFSIANTGAQGQILAAQGWFYGLMPLRLTIGTNSRGLRVCFLVGALLFAASIVLGLCRAAVTGSADLAGP
jgi:hypothetical protein